MRRTPILRAASTAVLLMAVVCIARAQGTTGAAQTAPAPAAPSTMDIYGFVMTDFGYDLRTNNPDWFDVVRPTKLPAFPLEFGRNGKTFAGVRQTRFGVKTTNPTAHGDFTTHFEFDMFGVGVDAGQTT